MLRAIKDKVEFKRRFTSDFREVLGLHQEFYEFMMNILVDGTAYVIGGFLRDIINEKKSLDIDIIVAISHEKLKRCLEKSRLTFAENRMKGIKIKLESLDIDIWSIDNNWAFRDSVVKRNEDYILDNLSDGCFYNFDGLVINVHTKNFRVNHYNDCVKSGKLDIIQKSKYYKLRNPTVEANILRAIYLNELYGLNFSQNCMSYLVKMVDNLSENYDLKSRLNIYLNKYEKYNAVLTIDEVMKSVSILKYIYSNRIIERNLPGQLNMRFDRAN